MKGLTLAKAQREKTSSSLCSAHMCAKARCLAAMKRRARRGSKEEGSGAVAWFDRSKEFILDSADASVTVQSDGLSLVSLLIWYPNQLCAQKDAERQRCGALKGVRIKCRYKKLTHLRCHCHRNTGTNQDPGRTRCTGYPLFLELLVRFRVNELRWTCLLYSRKKLSLKVSDYKVN